MEEVRVPERIVRRVFLSSTGRDLAEYRKVVADAIDALDDFKVVRMEDFGARASKPDDFCRWMAEECDVYVGLIGLLYGSTPPGEERSFTEREYEAAESAKIPRLVFLAEDNFPVPGMLLREAAASFDEIEAFRARLKADLVTGVFGAGLGATEELAKRVTAALHHLNWGSGPNTDPRGSSRDLIALERRYLEHLLDTHRYLDIRGMGVTDRTSLRMELLEIYVPLKGRCALPEGETWSEELRLAGRRMTKEELEEVGKVGKPQPVLEVLQKNDGVIVLGDPGAGKSTFLKFLTLKLARGEGAELGLGDRLPLLVSISAYAEKLASARLRLDRFIAEHFQDQVLDLPLESLIEPALKQGRVLVLLDGLDEVRDRSLQLTVVEQAKAFYNAHRRAGNKFVLSSRLVGYKEVRPTAEGLVECTLVDFDDEEIELFLDRWVGVQERAVLGETGAAVRSAAQEKAELQEALRHNEAVRALAANPLLLTILALMKRQGVALPEQRVRLYAVYIRTLLETWNPVRGLEKRPVSQRNALEILKTLTPLALWIHQTSPGVGLVKRRDLLGKLAEILKEKGEAGPEPEQAALSFLGGLGDSSLLLERGSDRYGFIHLTFLEYLAGCELARLDQLGPDRLFEAIAAKIGVPAWREVILLAIGYLGAVGEREISAGELLKRLVAEPPGEPGEAVALAGEALADLKGAGLGAEVREVVTAALLQTMRDDAKVVPVRRAAAGRALSRVGDPRPEVMTLEGMRFCWVPPGPFLMGTPKTKESEKEAWRPEWPRHEVDLPYGYWTGLYTVTVAQFRAYLEEAGIELESPEGLRGDLNAPMTIVSWREATAFCGWLTAIAGAKGWLPEGWRVALPSEAEWEKAARGGIDLAEAVKQGSWPGLAALGPPAAEPNPFPARRYPWGEEFDRNRVNSWESENRRPSAFGCFPGGASPCGAEELSGNVFEWTRSRNEDYPYLPSTERESTNQVASAQVLRVLRGGAFNSNSGGVRCAFRYGSVPGVRDDSDIGFRVVLSPFPL